MKKLTLSIFTILIYSAQLFSIGQEWVSRYNGAGNTLDWSYAIAIDQAGFVVVTGYSTGSGTGKDYKTIKYNHTGGVLWEATFNGPINGGDYSNAIVIDNTGNIFVTGRVDYGTTGSDIVTIKYNSSGVQQWFARFNGTGNGLDEGRSIHLDDAGNVYVSGKTTGTTSGLDVITIKYNPDGSLVWSMAYNGPGNNEDYGAGLDIDNSGNVYVGACSIGSGTGQDFTVIKYNNAGTEQWVKRYNGAGNGGDAVVGIKIDSDNNVIAGGYTDMGSAHRHNFLTIKYNPAGNMMWERQYNGTSSHIDLAISMTVDVENNVYLTGLTTQTYGTRLDSNYGTLKYDPNGNLQWFAYYDGPNNSVDVSRSIHVDLDMNVYITGSSKGTGSDDYATIKYSTSGAQLWVMSYNGTGNSGDYSSSVVADNEGNAYVTGRSFGSGSDFDYATIKYGNLVGIEPVSNEIPASYSLSQNYPNPFNPSTSIKFSVPLQTNAVLKIHNALGTEVDNILFGNISAGYYKYSYNAGKLSSGVYFYTLLTDNFRETKKMILLK